MKNIRIALSVAAILVAAAVLSVGGAPSALISSGLGIVVEENNPWTNLELNNAADSFQFAIVTDRTGGRRPGVFGRAVEKINLLQPEFVVSVGDLIEGYTEDPGMWALEWAEFENLTGRLEMPFFLCAGNHDISNLPMSGDWQRKFGRSYYDFRYRDCLFLVLNTEEVPEKGKEYQIGQEQQKWVQKVLAENRNVRWTFVFMHKPTWTYYNVDHAALGWQPVEDALQGRRYTVFAGHKHQYAKFLRKGQEYYMLATTGGASDLSGIPNGRFDHFVWVTMKEAGPVLANIFLDGVESSDVRTLPDAPPAAKK